MIADILLLTSDVALLVIPEWTTECGLARTTCMVGFFAVWKTLTTQGGPLELPQRCAMYLVVDEMKGIRLRSMVKLLLGVFDRTRAKDQASKIRNRSYKYSEQHLLLENQSFRRWRTMKALCCVLLPHEPNPSWPRKWLLCWISKEKFRPQNLRCLSLKQTKWFGF
jgi:hypothetical protein